VARKYTNTHEWVSDNGNGEYVVGITDYAQRQMGDIVFVELPNVGDQVSAGNEIGVIESVKAAGEFYSPLSGKVLATNDEVVDSPDLVNTDCYGDGWFYKIKASKPSEFNGLMSEDAYKKLIDAS
jgi:glycine cleavage system H protein